VSSALTVVICVTIELIDAATFATFVTTAAVLDATEKQKAEGRRQKAESRFVLTAFCLLPSAFCFFAYPTLVIPSNSINRLSFVITIPSSHSRRHDSAGLSLSSLCPFM
jgi:hypothetical protein